MRSKIGRAIPIVGAVLLCACSKSLEPVAEVPIPTDDRFRVGAARQDIMPVPYGEDGSCPKGRFCFELPIHFSDELDAPSLPYPAKPPDGVSDGCWEWKESAQSHRQKNQSEIMEGFLDNPTPDPATCREGFVDANGNGQFDGLWMGGFDEGRPATAVDTVASIYTKVMVLQQRDRITAVIGLPFVGFPTLQLAAMRARLSGETNGKISGENIILYVHHNHSLPDPQGLWGPNLFKNFDIKGPGGEKIGDFLRIPALDELAFPVGSMNFHNFPYWLWVEDRVSEALQEALLNLKPAKMRFGEHEQPHREVGCLKKSFQREGEFPDVDGNGYADVSIDCDNDGIPNTGSDRGILAKGNFGAGPTCLTPTDLAEKPIRFLMGDSRLPTVVDHNVYTWQFVEADNESNTIATFVIWGSHVEASPGGNTRLTGDYAEYACNYVEDRAGGICLFQIGPQGGLTGPLSTTAFKIDPDGRYFDCDGNPIEGTETLDDPLTLVEGGLSIALVPNGQKQRDGGLNIERGVAVGFQIAKTGLAAIEGQPPHEVKEFLTASEHVLLPMDNPYFYVGGKLEILSGFSLVLRKGFKYEKLKDLVYADELPSNVAGPGQYANLSCGPAICIRTTMNLLTLRAQGPDGSIRKVGWLTNPGEIFPEWLVGRAATEFYFEETDPGKKFELEDMAGTGEAPNFPRDLFTTNINPQVYDAIRGLRQVAMEDLGEGENYDAFFVTAQTQSSLGYQPPHSEFMLAYEGFMDDVIDNVGLIDLILSFSGGVKEIFHLSENDVGLTFEALLGDVLERYSEVMTDYERPKGVSWRDQPVPRHVHPHDPGPRSAVRRHEQAGGHNLSSHPNVYEETVSLGPRTGLILYNAGHGLLTQGKYPAEPFYSPMPRGDPNTDPEIQSLEKFND